MVLVVKNLPSNAGDTVSIPGLESSPGVRLGSPFQYSCLEKPMDKGAWRVTKSWIQLKWLSMHTKWYNDQNGFNAFWSWFGLKYFHQGIIPRWLLEGLHAMQVVESQFLNHRLNISPYSPILCPWQWKPRILTSRQWGNSPSWLFYLILGLVKGVLLDFQIFEFSQMYYY